MLRERVSVPVRAPGELALLKLTTSPPWPVPRVTPEADAPVCTDLLSAPPAPVTMGAPRI